MASLLEIHHLSIHREGQPVLAIDRLTVEEGETLAIIGPNGAGKSTLLLTLAHLLKPTAGQVLFRGQPISGDLAYRRRIGLVLQDPLLLDASVFDNVAMGLHYRHLPRREIAPRVHEWLDRLGIGHLHRRSAGKLSGGEAQRVSLARAFVIEPEVLLLDEPFGALDAPTRALLLDDFRTLLQLTATTAVFVTHDQDEAMLLGDRVAVLLGGRLRQIGTPEEVFSSPADADVATFVGVETVVAGRVIQAQEGLLTVEAHGFQLEAVGEVELGRAVLLCLRPEDVTLWAIDFLPYQRSSDGGGMGRGSARNRLAGTIVHMTPQGPLVRVIVDCGFPLVGLITRASARQMGLKEGQQVTATFKASAIHLIPR